MQQRLVEIADTPDRGDAMPRRHRLEQFLAGLRTAWQEGEVRPTGTAEAEGEARSATARSVRGSDGAAAGVVRGRAVADVARIV